MMAWRDLNLVLLGASLVVGCSELPEEVMTTTGPDSSSSGTTTATTIPGSDSSGVEPTAGSQTQGEESGESGETGDSTAGTGGSDETTGTSTGERCTDEVCDGVDNDCDDEIDEGCSCVDGTMEGCFSGDPGQEGVGQCVGGTRECVDGTWGACVGEVTAVAEECNGLDDDCDGVVDEDFGEVNCGMGACQVTVDSCVGGVPQVCMPGDPVPEECNGMDDDCDGMVDEIMCECTNGTMQPCYGGPMGTEGVGTCTGGMQNCTGGSWGACNGDVLPIPEICGNGMDDDCDGMVDDGCCSQVVVEPSFESGTPNPAWAEASVNFGTPLCTVATCGAGGGSGPRTGDWWAWFGGYDGFEAASLAQDVVIPMGTATLSIWLEINECAGTVEDSLVVTIDGMPQLTFDNGDPACGMNGYVEHTTDVSAFADGGVHTVTIEGEVFGSGPPMSSITNFFVDDVTIEICS